MKMGCLQCRLRSKSTYCRKAVKTGLSQDSTKRLDSALNNYCANRTDYVGLDVKSRWNREQEKLKEKLILEDRDRWAKHKVVAMREGYSSQGDMLEYVAGVDLSFVKGDEVNACAALVVIRLPHLELVYSDYKMVQLTEPYIPGFLAFREVSFLVDLIEKLGQQQPKLKPQLIMVDGNGILHIKGFGLASHLGVLTSIPTLGVAKKLFHVDGLEKGESHKEKIKTSLLKGGDWFPLIGDSGKVYGAAVRSTDSSVNPIYISQGHLVSLETALWVVRLCTKYRIPEPVRLADLNSREYIRENWNK